VTTVETKDSWKMVGQAVSRADAVEKAAGGTLFADDFDIPGCLAGKVVRSGLAAAEIVRLDAEAARAIPGVRAVLTADDIPGVNTAHGEDFPVLAQGRVRSVGDVVALVAADSDEAVQAAVDWSSGRMAAFTIPNRRWTKTPRPQPLSSRWIAEMWTAPFRRPTLSSSTRI
jgi:xanthine dehydrogenase molybdopterin-binding subunit B